MLVFIYESSFVSVNLAGQYNNKKKARHKNAGLRELILMINIQFQERPL